MSTAKGAHAPGGVVVVTGASAGVGRATAVAFARTADSHQVEQVAQDVEESLGAIDVWVNVAFTSVFARFIDIEPDEYRRVTEVDYLGYVHGTLGAHADAPGPRR